MSYQDTLRNILSFAHSIKSSSKLNKPPSPRANDNSTATLPSISLPIPDGISPTLLQSIGCSPATAKLLSDAFVRSAHQICAAHDSAYGELVSQMASDPDRMPKRINNIRSFLENQYREQLRAAEQLAVEQAQQLILAQRSTQKKTFNQEFVPLLEKYFEYNAYPSAPDRAVLARKSMMTPRQIEVWFQNHRNRSKKEGKILRRLASGALPPKLSLESLEKKMPFFIIPGEEQKEPTRLESPELESSGNEVSDSDELRPQNVNEPMVFSLVSPPHAFPTVYPPTCNHDYDPFPSRRGKNLFPPPIWKRRPATSPPQYQVPDFDDFILEFTVKLVLRDTSPKGKHQTNTPHHTVIRPWFTATHTIPPPAPHPAFIRPVVPVATPQALPIPLLPTPAPPERLHPFRSPSPDSRPATMIPSASASVRSQRRKIAHLPRRTPKNFSLAHRSASPTASDAFSPGQSLSGSRASSFTSEPSSTRRSSSSSISSLSPSLLTPVSTRSLSPDISLSFSEFDFQGHDDPLRDCKDALTIRLLYEIPNSAGGF